MEKGVIFDFDGVIINSSDIQKYALMESYKIVVGEGFVSFDEFLSHSGDSLENIFIKMKLPMEMIKPYRRISCEMIPCIKIYDGMVELLEQMKVEGYKCALCTGKDRKRTLEILQRLKLDKYLETIVCSDDVVNPKPYPDSLLLAVKKLGINLEDAVMIGDARNDILCAKSAGVKVIAVTWGEVPRRVLEQEAPNCIVDTVDELSSAIFNLILGNEAYRSA